MEEATAMEGKKYNRSTSPINKGYLENESGERASNS
jgi:hypothetical protein